MVDGEEWFGNDALGLGGVDKSQTFHDYIIEHLNDDSYVYHVQGLIHENKGFLKAIIDLTKRTITTFLYARQAMKDCSAICNNLCINAHQTIIGIVLADRPLFLFSNLFYTK